MKLIRNSGKVLANLKTLPDQPVICKVPMTVHFPVRFTEIGLAQFGSTVQIYGLFAIILESGEYSLCNVNALIQTKPSVIEKILIDNVEYYQFKYLPGDELILTTDLVQRSSLLFLAIDEFFFKGKVPYYVEYDDLGKLFDSAKKHTGTSANITPAVVEFMAAYISRKRENKNKYIREGAKSMSDFDRKHLAIVPLRSVLWSAPGTVNKLTGAHYDDGVIAALAHQNTELKNIERVLRA